MEKPISDMTKHKRMKYGVDYLCKECSRNDSKIFRANNTKELRKKDARYKLMSRYGITVEERDKLFERGCDICGVMENLNIDHSHNKGPNVRGVLCGYHNRVLGLLGDELEEVKSNTNKYIEYLE